jgi:allophycocyanin-B
MRDIGWYIRLVSYCLLAGNEKPLEEIGLIGMKELYNSVGIPLENVRQYMLCVKAEVNAMLTPEDAAEVIPYFDLILQVISSPGAPYFQNNGRTDWQR